MRIQDVNTFCLRYSTAYADSDYTDRDTDKEEGGREREQESEEEEEEDRSCATVLTLRQEDSQEEEVEDEEMEDEGRLQLMTEAPSGELALLLAQSDVLHTGDATLKAEGFRLLLENRAEVMVCSFQGWGGVSGGAFFCFSEPHLLAGHKPTVAALAWHPRASVSPALWTVFQSAVSSPAHPLITDRSKQTALARQGRKLYECYTSV